MAQQTISLALDGEIPLPLFARAVENFSSLVEGLSTEVVGAGEIRWEIERLEAGSAFLAVRGESHEAELVEKVVAAYESVGRAMEEHRPIPYSERVSTAVRNLTSVLNGDIHAVTLGTPNATHRVTERMVDENEDAALLIGETTLFGEIRRVGGTAPRAMIRLDQGQTIYFDVKREIIQDLGSRIYTHVALHGLAKWRAEDLSLYSFFATGVSDSPDRTFSSVIDELAQRIGRYYSNIDPDDYITHLRYH